MYNEREVTVFTLKYILNNANTTKRLKQYAYYCKKEVKGKSITKCCLLLEDVSDFLEIPLRSIEAYSLYKRWLIDAKHSFIKFDIHQYLEILKKKNWRKNGLL
jgi:hypothetical protein